MGISHESFLRLTPKKLEIYAEAYKLMLRDRDYENWLMGQYNMKAFSVVLDQVLAGMNKRKSKAKYFESPILEMAEKNNEPLSEKELQLQRELFVAKLEALKTNFEINHFFRKIGKTVLYCWLDTYGVGYHNLLFFSGY